MKPLVLASYAQFGVGAVGRRRFLRLRKKGGLQWHGDYDPPFAETSCCAEAYSLRGNRLLYEAGCEPALRCETMVERCVQCSLPCVSCSGSRCQAYKPLARGKV